MRTASGTTWLASDGQNSRQIAVNASTGAATRTYYTPYGAIRAGAATLPTDQSFLGHVLDSASGLLQDGARYYDPSLGQLLSPDPLVGTANNKTLSPYGYAGNNPAAFADPSGLVYSGGDLCSDCQGTADAAAASGKKTACCSTPKPPSESQPVSRGYNSPKFQFVIGNMIFTFQFGMSVELDLGKGDDGAIMVNIDKEHGINSSSVDLRLPDGSVANIDLGPLSQVMSGPGLSQYHRSLHTDFGAVQFSVQGLPFSKAFGHLTLDATPVDGADGLGFVFSAHVKIDLGRYGSVSVSVHATVEGNPLVPGRIPTPDVVRIPDPIVVPVGANLPSNSFGWGWISDVAAAAVTVVGVVWAGTKCLTSRGTVCPVLG